MDERTYLNSDLSKINAAVRCTPDGCVVFWARVCYNEADQNLWR